MKPDGIRGGGVSYPGKPSCPVVERCRRRQSAEPQRRSRGGEMAEGGRSAGSTDDSGPMKPGNSVEEKTLMSGTGVGMPTHPGPAMPSASLVWGNSRTKGDCDRVEESTQSRGGRTRNRNRDTRIPTGIPIGECRGVIRGPVQAKRPITARPSLTLRPDHGVAT